jgi:hypothetical protein
MPTRFPTPPPPPDALSRRAAAERRYDGALPRGERTLRLCDTAELRRMLRLDLRCLRGFRRDGRRWAAAPAARRIERQIRRTWESYRGVLAEERAAAAPAALAAARRRVRDALGRLQAARVGRLTGEAFRNAAAAVGLDTALVAYRAAQRRARR